MGLRMHRTFKQAHQRTLMQGTTQEPRLLKLPGGSWWRQANPRSMDSTDGHLPVLGPTVSAMGVGAQDGWLVETHDGLQLHANLKQHNGSFEEKNVFVRDEHDTLSVRKGEFQLGRCAGSTSLTTRQVMELCEIFDDFDRSGKGFLTADDLLNVTNALGEDIDLNDMEKVVANMDLDGGRATGNTPGIDFPEFLQLCSAALKDGCHKELNAAWGVLSRGDRTADRQNLSNMMEALGFHIQDIPQILEEFLLGLQLGAMDKGTFAEMMYSDPLRQSTTSLGSDDQAGEAVSLLKWHEQTGVPSNYGATKC